MTTIGVMNFIGNICSWLHMNMSNE